jgi:beta-glucanase (GH16 family)
MQDLLRQKSMPHLGPERPGHLKGLERRYSRYPAMGLDSRRQSSYNTRATRVSSTHLLESCTSTASLAATNPFSETTFQGENEKRGMVDDMSSFNPYCGSEKGFILYVNELEDDDDDHMPKDDDDFVFKPKVRDYFNWRVVVSTIGGIFLLLGILSLFIVLPVIYFTGIVRMQLPGVDWNYWPNTAPPDTWATVNHRNYSLLNNVRRGLIDPDTPESAKIRKSTFDGVDLNLVFSDEFNKNNRTFYPGDDPYWAAPNIWYGATQDMEWYDPDAVTTYDGTLQLRLDQFPNHNLNYRSGMLNSWNQLCFKGGAFEVSLSLPGPAGVPGLWPGVWSMGNLGRPGYKATTEGSSFINAILSTYTLGCMDITNPCLESLLLIVWILMRAQFSGLWPYTYNNCDLGITPNQSSPDGLSYLPGQRLSSCTCPGQDHPNPGTGRGAPEIDILEASVDPNNRIGVVTQSYQVAPFDVYWRPNSDFLQIPNYNTTSMNGYCGGPFQQAISGTTLLNNDWYDGNEYQKYAFEYEPGTTDDGKIAWFVGEDQSFMMDGRAIGQNGNVAARVVSEEPMSMVLNLGFSAAWSEILLDQLRFPTIMRIDYVRIYQRPGQESITCDPPGYPTTEYIENHAVAYNNPNLTVSGIQSFKKVVADFGRRGARLGTCGHQIK